MTKKGQMEVMGLIVIVVLLTLAIFFVVSFKTRQPTKNIQNSFSDDQLSSKFLISFLKTSAGCRDHTIEDLIQDCAVEKRITCQGVDSCMFVNKTTFIFINETFFKQKKKFNFTIENLPINITFFDDCGKDQDKDLSWQPLSLYPYPGTVIVKLYVCK